MGRTPPSQKIRQRIYEVLHHGINESEDEITTLAILGFLGTWNDFMGPLIYLNRERLYTAALGLRFFQITGVAGYAGTEPRDHLLMAGTAIMTAPMLLVFILAQRYFVQGVVLSGIKM